MQVFVDFFPKNFEHAYGYRNTEYSFIGATIKGENHLNNIYIYILLKFSLPFWGHGDISANKTVFCILYPLIQKKMGICLVVCSECLIFANTL